MSDDFDTSTIGSDRYTEVTTQSWFSRIAQSFVGLIVGPILVLVGIGLLVWNESRAVTTARSLAEGLGAVISVETNAPLPQNDGRLVHVSGPAAAGARLADPDFHVSVTALSLHRQVQMLQWREREESHTEKNLGGSQTTVKTFSYTRDWSASPIDSSHFRHPEGHANPGFIVPSRIIAAKDARIGGFHLADKLLTTLPADEVVGIDPAAVDGIKARLGRPVSAIDGTLFVGRDSGSPEIGDLKISFTDTPAGDITVIAAQKGSDFAGYQTKAGDVLETIKLGLLTPKQIFAELESDNAVLTWILRAVGTLLVLVGFSVFFGPIAVLADVLPFLGDIVGFGTFFLAFMLTFIVVPVTIAVAWLAFRPLVSVAVLGVGLIGVLAVRFLWPARRKPVPPPQPLFAPKQW